MRTKAEAKRLKSPEPFDKNERSVERSFVEVAVQDIRVEEVDESNVEGDVEVEVEIEEDRDNNGAEVEVETGHNGEEEEMQDQNGEEEEDRIDDSEAENAEEHGDAADFHDEGSDDEDHERDNRDNDRGTRRVGEGKLFLGQGFFSGDAFKQAVLEYALSTGTNIEQARWEQLRLGFKYGMGGSCGWRIYCSYDEPTNKWLVKSYHDVHVYIPNSRCKILKTPSIARLFLDKLRINDSLMPREIQDSIKEQWKLSASTNQCQKARLLALKWIQDEYNEQFTRLRGYCKEIQDTNPGSTCEIETVENESGEDVFDRFYVCFDILRSSWLRTCRRIMGLDGCFLKTTQKGVLLSAIGRDPNNQIYPLAWAVVQNEDGPNWEWFIKMLKRDFPLGDGSGFVFVSDRQKGLINAIKQEVPNIEHRWCVKHIYENLKSKHARKALLKPLIWNLSWSYSPTEYAKNLDKVRDYNLSLYNDLLKEDPKTWCRAYFRLGNCCEDVDNNFTESFNATIVKARDKSLVLMLETIRRQSMVRIAKRSMKANAYRGNFTPYVTDILESQRADATKCTIFQGTHGVNEVHLYGNSYTVNLRRQTCACCKWEISGIPCVHALGAIMRLGLPVDKFISPFFLVSRWRDLYTTSIIPVRGPRFWMRYVTDQVTAPPVPKMPGRKKKEKVTKKQKRKQKQRKLKITRIKGKHESPSKKTKKKEVLSRNGRIMHCSKCRESGHNITGCGKKRSLTGASSSHGRPKRTKSQGLSPDASPSAILTISQSALSQVSGLED